MPKSEPERKVFFELLREGREMTQQLSKLKYEPAIPVLLQLHRNFSKHSMCPGHYVYDIGTEEAHRALRSCIFDEDRSLQFLAVKSYILKQPSKAFDELESFFSEDSRREKAHLLISVAVLRFLGPSFYTNKGLGWHDPRIPELLRDDDRWVQLALRLRRDGKLGEPARHLLSALPYSSIEEALIKWPDSPPKAIRTSRLSAAV